MTTIPAPPEGFVQDPPPPDGFVLDTPTQPKPASKPYTNIVQTIEKATDHAAAAMDISTRTGGDYPTAIGQIRKDAAAKDQQTWDTIYGVTTQPAAKQEKPWMTDRIPVGDMQDPKVVYVKNKEKAKEIGVRHAETGQQLPAWSAVGTEVLAAPNFDIGKLEYAAEIYKAALPHYAEFQSLDQNQQNTILNGVDQSVIDIGKAIRQEEIKGTSLQGRQTTVLQTAPPEPGAIGKGWVAAERAVAKPVAGVFKIGKWLQGGESGSVGKFVIEGEAAFSSDALLSEYSGDSTVKTVAGTAGMLATFAMPGGMAFNVAGTFGNEREAGYAKAKEAGFTEVQAQGYGVANGTLNAAALYLPMAKTIKFAKGAEKEIAATAAKSLLEKWDKFGATAPKAAIEDALLFALQGAVNNGTVQLPDVIKGNKPFDLKALVESANDSAKFGLVLGGMSGTAGMFAKAKTPTPKTAKEVYADLASGDVTSEQLQAMKNLGIPLNPDPARVEATYEAFKKSQEAPGQAGTVETPVGATEGATVPPGTTSEAQQVGREVKTDEFGQHWSRNGENDIWQLTDNLSPELTSTKRQVVDELLVARGKDPIPDVPGVTVKSLVDEADAKITAEPTWIDTTINARMTDNRPLTSLETAGMQLSLRRMETQYAVAVGKMADARLRGDDRAYTDAQASAAGLDIQLNRLTQMSRLTWREWGRAGRTQQILLARDESIVNLTANRVHAKGGEALTSFEREALVEQVKQIADLKAQLEVSNSKATEQSAFDARDKAWTKLQKPERAARRPRSATKLITEESYKVIDARIKERMKGKSILDLLRDQTGAIDPQNMADVVQWGVYKVERGMRDLAAFTAEFVTHFGPDAAKLAEDIFNKASGVIGKSDHDKSMARIKELAADNRIDAISPAVNKLARFHIDSGIKERDAVVDAVHTDLKTIIPDITRSQTEDALSGLGKFKALSKDPTSVTLREIKGELLQLGKLRSLDEGVVPPKTGVQRQSPTNENRNLQKEVRETMKAGDFQVTDPETQLRTPQDAAKRRLSNIIKDIEADIANGEVRFKTRSAMKQDAELIKMRDKLAEVKKLYNETFGDELWNRQWGASATKRLQKMNERIAKKDFGPRVKIEKPPLNKDNMKLRYELDKVRREIVKGNFEAKLAQQSIGADIIMGVAKSLNLTRAIMTSFDLSAVLRQGGFLALGHPVKTVKASGQMFKALWSKEGQFRAEEAIRQSDTYERNKEAGLQITENDAWSSLSQEEEAYLGSNWYDRMAETNTVNPLRYVGRGIQASQRAYTTFLNVLRTDTMNSMAKSLSKGKQPTMDELKAIANFVNVATGRGSGGMKFDQATVLLNNVFFAPRLVASRFNLLFGTPFIQGSWRTRKLIAYEYARYLTGVGVVYSVALSAGAKIGVDPTNADFGKIIIGNTRIDILSGLSQTAVLLARLGVATKRSVTGDKLAYDQGWGNISRFLRSKLAPIPGLAIDIPTGKNVVGDPITWRGALQNQLSPMSVRDIYEAMKEQGVPAGAAMGVLSIFGGGLQTYKPKYQKPRRKK